jgi:hypothetical protein
MNWGVHNIGTREISKAIGYARQQNPQVRHLSASSGVEVCGSKSTSFVASEKRRSGLAAAVLLHSDRRAGHLQDE